MKIKKSILSLCLLATFAASSFATVTPDTKTTSATVTEIYKTVQNLKLDFSKIEAEHVTLKFMVNADNEIIVLSTKDSEVDGTLKSALNYKSVKNNDLVPYKVYLLPIRFES